MVHWGDFFSGLDLYGLLDLLISAMAALICITFHELSHGFAAYKLGDPTAKNAGRLTLNPIKHIDIVGLLMMLVARVGWAKPVPVDMRYFKNPKRGMAITALAGPASNFVLAFLAVAVWSLIYHLPSSLVDHMPVYILLSLLANIAVLSVGLGLFNLIPLPPLDGSKVLFALLPERVYYTILRYERYVMVLVVVLTASGVFSQPLGWLMEHTLDLLCHLCALGEMGVELIFLFSQLFQFVRF